MIDCVKAFFRVNKYRISICLFSSYFLVSSISLIISRAVESLVENQTVSGMEEYAYLKLNYSFALTFFNDFV